MSNAEWKSEKKITGDIPDNTQRELERLHKLLQHEDMEIVNWAKTLIEQIHMMFFGVVFLPNYEPIPDEALKVKL